MNLGMRILVTILPLTLPAAMLADDGPRHADLKAKLQWTLTRHLSRLIGEDGSVATMKGKTAEGDTALSFYLLFEATSDQRFRKAAIGLADRVLQDMRATKFGVLPIKEKEKPDGEKISGGGPPALGAYASGVAYILHKEGCRGDDLKYIAAVLDRFPWNEEGWWASTIDVETGESKLSMSKPSIINKTVAVAKAAGILSGYVREIDPALSASLKRKTDKCLYAQVIPAQEADGFWHYSLTGNDPKDKDVLGYFMLTTSELMDLQQFNPAYCEKTLTAAIKKAQAFTLKCIVPMTAPNAGNACLEHLTRGTPSRYTLEDDLKRSFQVSRLLIGGGDAEEGMKIMDIALNHFPFGNAGQEGAHASRSSSLILKVLCERRAE